MSAPSITVTPEKFQLVLGVNDDITISLTNVGFEAVIYRLLTTAPERYIVKHTKGVIKGNSTATISITLNPKHVTPAVEQQQAAGGGKVIKDDFRLEYAVQGADDVIEPRANNVPQLIKDKKAANPSLVLKKMLRCHVLLDAADATSSVTNPSSVGGGEAANRDNIRMSAKEMQENTWLEKNKRKETTAGPGNSATAGPGNGLGSVVARKADTTQRIKILLVIFAVLAAGGIWMLME